MSCTAPAHPASRRTRRIVVPAFVVVCTASAVLLGHDASAATHWSTTSAGEVDDPVTVYADVPAVTKLDPSLLGALRKAAKDAAADGVELRVNSGWRSARYQQTLLDEAIATYGSRRDAERWVATPTTSAHVTGHAVDVGGADAAAWLTRHGAAYGLCQIYANESWHFELRPEAVTQGCPARYADASQDPRMK